MNSRLPTRLNVLGQAVTRSLKRRHRPAGPPQRILIAHHLLLGDTLMLTPLLAKLRQQYPGSDIVMTANKTFVPLYHKKPYGVAVHAYDPRHKQSVRALLRQPGFDLAVVPGDNRYSWLARALDARWIIAFAGDRPAYKSWPVDELISYPSVPMAWGDMVADLVAGPPPQPYQPEDWPTPDCLSFPLPEQPYCVLHVGASSRLKLWEPDKWRALATHITQQGFQIVWSSGPAEQQIVADIDSEKKYLSYAGQLDLPQLWHLIAGATLLICPDTGVAHLGRIVDTPTITLFGPGSATLYGAGRFWRNSRYIALSTAISCRNQHLLFKREIDWVQRCGRSTSECRAPACMQQLTYQQVRTAADRFLMANAS